MSKLKVSDLKKDDVVGPFVFNHYEQCGGEFPFYFVDEDDDSWCNFSAPTTRRLLDAFGIVRDGKPLQEAPVSEPNWHQWIGQECHGLGLFNPEPYTGKLGVECNADGPVIFDGRFNRLVKYDSIRPVSEDVEWDPATEPFQEGDVATAPNGNTWVRNDDGMWYPPSGRFTRDSGLDDSLVESLSLNVTRKKSKPSAVPSVVNMVKGLLTGAKWHTNEATMNVTVPIEDAHRFLGQEKTSVTVILGSAIVDTFKTMNTEIMLKSDGMKRHVERHHTVIVLEDSHE